MKPLPDSLTGFIRSDVMADEQKRLAVLARHRAEMLDRFADLMDKIRIGLNNTAVDLKLAAELARMSARDTVRTEQDG